MSLEDLKKEAKEKFSDNEINSFINMAKILAGKPVLTLVMEVIKEANTVKKGNTSENQRECDRICKLIEKAMPYNYTGFTQCEFDEMKFKLNITLSIVKRGYKTDIAIPDAKYAQDLLKQYKLLKELAHGFWAQFAEDNKSLYERICKFCGSMDMSKLTVPDDNPTVMYFDECNGTNVGIFAYYVDEEGRPLRKK